MLEPTDTLLIRMPRTDHRDRANYSLISAQDIEPTLYSSIANHPLGYLLAYDPDREPWTQEHPASNYRIYAHTHPGIEDITLPLPGSNHLKVIYGLV